MFKVTKVYSHCEKRMWTVARLSKEAKVSIPTARKAYRGEPISIGAIEKIAKALDVDPAKLR